MPQAQIAIETILQVSNQLGLTLMGISSAEPLGATQSLRLKEWQEQGFAGEMEYMLRAPELFTEPCRLLEGAKSIISFSLPYSRKPQQDLRPGHGRIARYAWGRDYHRVFKKKLKLFTLELQKLCGFDHQFKIFVDAVPLLERAIAESSGQGFIGKNTMFIQPRIGSFNLLAEILTTFDLPVFSKSRSKASCGTCKRCSAECPTGALVDDYKLDSRRCISYLTIEKRGMLSHQERQMIGEWLFGCDICQDVCPFNHRPLKLSIPAVEEYFEPSSGAGQQLQLKEIIGLEDREGFIDRFAGTPLVRAKREGLVRNAICVAVNTQCVEVVDLLKERARNDSSAVVRAHAHWGVIRLSQIKSLYSKVELRQVIESISDSADEVLLEKQELLRSV